jgi:hypothetical protein
VNVIRAKARGLKIIISNFDRFTRTGKARRTLDATRRPDEPSPPTARQPQTPKATTSSLQGCSSNEQLQASHFKGGATLQDNRGKSACWGSSLLFAVSGSIPTSTWFCEWRSAGPMVAETVDFGRRGASLGTKRAPSVAAAAIHCLPPPPLPAVHHYSHTFWRS